MVLQQKVEIKSDKLAKWEIVGTFFQKSKYMDMPVSASSSEDSHPPPALPGTCFLPVMKLAPSDFWLIFIDCETLIQRLLYHLDPRF